MGRLAFLLYGGLVLAVIATSRIAPQTPQPSVGAQVRTCFDARVGLYKPCRDIWAERDV
ncbi:hypothetical protein [Labrys neptuniae]